jgi:Tfp pilus assembly protein PilV
MSRSHTLFERIRREEAGLGMLEVLASALLVVIISVGVLKTFDAANAATGNTKNRAVAADLAQQDQERMRAFRAKELSNLNATYTRTVAGVNYTITSTAIWVNDGSGSRRCGLTSGRADYLRIRSSVVWDRMRGAAPVTSTSLYAPPSGSFGDEGNLGFEILNRSAAGVPGVSVSLSGPATRSGVTDSDGCVFFAFLPQGQYTATISKSGFVDYNGNATITKTFGVTGGTTQVQPLDYDQAATITANIRSWRTTAVGPPLPASVAAQAGHVSFGHGQYNAPFWKFFGTGTLRSSFGAAQGLNAFFPFTSSYSAYTGNCAPNSGMAATVPALTPGGSVSVNVNEPGLQIRAAASGTTAGTPLVTMPQGTTVTLTPRSTGCTGMLTLRLDSAGWVGPTNVATTVDPGVPYGAYDICASYNGMKRIRTNILVDGPTGDSVTVPNTTTDPAGSCP